MRFSMILLAGLLAACGDEGKDTGTDDTDGGDTDEVVEGGDAARGADVYADTCALCHGASGEGGLGPAMADQMGKTDEELHDIIQNGKGDMAPVEISEQETADVIAYLRETFGNG